MLTEKDIENIKKAGPEETVKLEDGTELVKAYDDCSCEHCYLNTQGMQCASDMGCVYEDKETGRFKTFQFHVKKVDEVRDFVIKHLLYQSKMRGYWRIKLYEGYWKDREDAIDYAIKTITEEPKDIAGLEELLQ